MNQRGFTIVEILVVIVIIGLLATLVIVSFNGVQDRARAAQVATDKRSLTQAIMSARDLSGKTLAEITSSTWTAGSCYGKPTGTDLAALPKTDQCWVDYQNALDTIAAASGANINKLKDPWGRPYYIDENEGVLPSPCTPDVIAVFSRPFINNGGATNGQYIYFSLSTPPPSGC